MPVACISHGYAGYKLAGYENPRETKWSKHVADRLATVGGFMVVNTAGALHSSMPDVLLHTNAGMYYIEMKGETTPVRANQAIISHDFNSKSLYSRGELVCFVYKAPGILGLLRKDKSIYELTTVDALRDPQTFIDTVDFYSQVVMKDTHTRLIQKLVQEVQLAELPLRRYRVKHRIDESTKAYEVQTYSEQLAVKQVLGLTHSSSLSLYGGVQFDWFVQELTG